MSHDLYPIRRVAPATLSPSNASNLTYNNMNFLIPPTSNAAYVPQNIEVSSSTPANLEETRGLGNFSDIDPHVLNIIKQTERTDEEAWILYQHLKDYKFFSLFMSMTNELYQKEWLLHIFKQLRYERVSAGQVIFEEGEPSNGKMYIVLSGELVVMSKKLDSIEGSHLEVTAKLWDALSAKDNKDSSDAIDSQLSIDNNKDMMRRGSRRQSRLFTAKQASLKVLNNNFLAFGSKSSLSSIKSQEFASRSMSSFGKGKLGPDLKNRKLMYYGYVKNTLERGGYFGEKALEAINRKRTASVIAETDCDLLALTKEEYELIKKTFANKTKDLLGFVIDNMPGLNRRHSTFLLQNYEYLFEEKSISYKNHIFQEGEPGENFFLIYSGTCEIYRNIQVEDPSAFSTDNMKPRGSFLQTTKMKERIPLTVVKEGYLIGEEVLYMKNPCYSYSVKVTSYVCRVLTINKARFGLNFSREVFAKINEIFQEKKKHKNQILSDLLEKKGFDMIDTDINNLFLKCKKKVIPSPRGALSNRSSFDFKETTEKDQLSKLLRPRAQILPRISIDSDKPNFAKSLRLSLQNTPKDSELKTPQSDRIFDFKEFNLTPRKQIAFSKRNSQMQTSQVKTEADEDPSEIGESVIRIMKSSKLRYKFATHIESVHSIQSKNDIQPSLNELQFAPPQMSSSQLSGGHSTNENIESIYQDTCSKELTLPNPENTLKNLPILKTTSIELGAEGKSRNTSFRLVKRNSQLPGLSIETEESSQSAERRIWPQTTRNYVKSSFWNSKDDESIIEKESPPKQKLIKNNSTSSFLFGQKGQPLGAGGSSQKKKIMNSKGKRLKTSEDCPTGKPKPKGVSMEACFFSGLKNY